MVVVPIRTVARDEPADEPADEQADDQLLHDQAAIGPDSSAIESPTKERPNNTSGAGLVDHLQAEHTKALDKGAALSAQLNDTRYELDDAREELVELKTELERRDAVIKFLDEKLQKAGSGNHGRRKTVSGRSRTVVEEEEDPQEQDEETDDDDNEDEEPGLAARGKGKRLSVKVPDAPVLTDGAEPSYDDWVMKIEHKLKANADHFPSAQHKIGYIQNRLGGFASRQVLPRLRKESLNRIRRPEQIFEVLDESFADPDRRKTARREFHSLYQNRNSFAAFWSDFRRISVDLGLDEQTLVDELRERVNGRMKTAMVQDIGPTTLAALARRCRQYERNLIDADAQKPSFAQKPPFVQRSNLSAPTPTVLARAPDTRPAYDRQPQQQRLYRPPHHDPAKEQLMQQGKCFVCSKEGHVARECPEKRGQATVREVTIQEPTADGQQSDQAAGNA